MKNRTKTGALALALLLCLSLAACGGAEGGGSLWDSALYTAGTELGEGAKTITFECTAAGRSVAFTIHTDAEYLRGALEEHGLVAGDESEFGLYVKSVNGMAADYEADGLYWSLYVDGEYATSGVDTTAVTDGGSYAFVCEAA